MKRHLAESELYNQKLDASLTNTVESIQDPANTTMTTWTDHLRDLPTAKAYARALDYSLFAAYYFANTLAHFEFQTGNSAKTRVNYATMTRNYTASLTDSPYYWTNYFVLYFVPQIVRWFAANEARARSSHHRQTCSCSGERAARCNSCCPNVAPLHIWHTETRRSIRCSAALFRWMSAPKAILCTFQIIFISNCVVYDTKCLILSPAHARKKSTVAHLFKKNIYIYTVCNTGTKAI